MNKVGLRSTCSSVTGCPELDAAMTLVSAAADVGNNDGEVGVDDGEDGEGDDDMRLKMEFNRDHGLVLDSDVA